jgi:Domain of unknown function (DUF4783)
MPVERFGAKSCLKIHLKLNFLTMKNYVGLVLLASFFLLTGFRNGIEMDDIVVALKSGNASQLSKYFDNRIDLSLQGKSDNYSRSQAQMIIRDFFSNNEVRNFEVKHRGEQNGDLYCVGTLQTRSGNFRTTLFMKQKGDRQILQDLSFQSLE